MGAMAPVTFRLATVADLPTILALLADDAIARSRTGYSVEPTPAVRVRVTHDALAASA